MEPAGRGAHIRLDYLAFRTAASASFPISLAHPVDASASTAADGKV